jgi:hypothetical protein
MSDEVWRCCDVSTSFDVEKNDANLRIDRPRNDVLRRAVCSFCALLRLALSSPHPNTLQRRKRAHIASVFRRSDHGELLSGRAPNSRRAPESPEDQKTSGKLPLLLYDRSAFR